MEMLSWNHGKLIIVEHLLLVFIEDFCLKLAHSTIVAYHIQVNRMLGLCVQALLRQAALLCIAGLGQALVTLAVNVMALHSLSANPAIDLPWEALPLFAFVPTCFCYVFLAWTMHLVSSVLAHRYSVQKFVLCLDRGLFFVLHWNVQLLLGCRMVW